MNNTTLTGRIKFVYEKPIFGAGRFVLYVEESYGDGSDDFHGIPTYPAGKRFRPASHEDFQQIKVEGKVNEYGY